MPKHSIKTKIASRLMNFRSYSGQSADEKAERRCQAIVQSAENNIYSSIPSHQAYRGSKCIVGVDDQYRLRIHSQVKQQFYDDRIALANRYLHLARKSVRSQVFMPLDLMELKKQVTQPGRQALAV